MTTEFESRRSGLDHERPTDLELAQAGDRAATRRCVQHLGPAVWSLIRSRVEDQRAARTLVERAFAQLWRAGSDFDPQRESDLVYAARVTRRQLAQDGYPPSIAGSGNDKVKGASQPAASAGAEQRDVILERLRPILDRLTPVQKQLLGAALLGGPRSGGASVDGRSRSSHDQLRLDEDLRDLLRSARAQLQVTVDDPAVRLDQAQVDASCRREVSA